VDTKKASIPNTAIEELPKFVFNEAGDGTVALPLTGQEGLQMAGDDFIHRIVFRISGPVPGIDGHAGIAECTPRRSASNNGISEIQGAPVEKSVSIATNGRLCFVLADFHPQAS